LNATVLMLDFSGSFVFEQEKHGETTAKLKIIWSARKWLCLGIPSHPLGLENALCSEAWMKGAKQLSIKWEGPSLLSNAIKYWNKIREWADIVL